MLVLVKHVNLHFPSSIGHRVPKGGGTGPAGVDGKGVCGRLKLMLEDAQEQRVSWPHHCHCHLLNAEFQTIARIDKDR